jgi:hypothetical protein
MSITLAATGNPRSTTKQSTPPQPSLIFTPSPHLKIKKCPHFKRQCTPARVGPRLRGQVCGATALLLHDLSIPLNSSIPVQTCTSPQPLQGALQEPARLSLACSCNTPSLSCPSRRPRPHHCSPQRRRRAWAALPPFACDRTLDISITTYFLQPTQTVTSQHNPGTCMREKDGASGHPPMCSGDRIRLPCYPAPSGTYCNRSLPICRHTCGFCCCRFLLRRIGLHARNLVTSISRQTKP